MEAAVRASPNPMAAALGALCDMVRPERGGEVARYIPELATAEPEHFAVSLVSLVGRRYDAGDRDVAFTIQSISKPFVFALALAEQGLDEVLSHVGAEPSGEAFNAISLDPASGRPSNPMINAGAMATTSLIRASDPQERYERIRSVLSAFAGRELAMDPSVYRSEHETGDRNRALAYLMHNAGSLREPVEEVVDVYFRQCSVLVTAGDLAVMAATLANGGQNPVTSEIVVPAKVAEQTCAVMASCGMYDFAGEWMLRVGLPAKSGVSGGLVAVCPGAFGIGIFSPRLDSRGNSVRAVRASELIADRFSLQLVHRPRPTTPVASFDGDRSTPALAGAGPVPVMSLQGDIEFPAAEIVLSTVEPLLEDSEPRPRWLVIDIERVTNMQPVPCVMLGAMIRDLATRGTTVIVSDHLARGLLPDAAVEVASPEQALEWCALQWELRTDDR